MQARWQLQPAQDGSAFTDLPRVVASILARRGVEKKSAASFLYPEYSRDIHDPFAFRDMLRVVARITDAIANKERVVIFGDYDADGVCASALLATTLQELGLVDLTVYLPDRTSDGYGLNLNAISGFARDGVSLLITLDCGITNVAEVAFAAEHNINTIIVDHHLSPETLPAAYATINPKVPGETYPFHDLAAVGLAFKLAQALIAEQRKADVLSVPRWEAFEKWLLDFVAIATVTDLVPLAGENRALLHFGLRVINKTRRPGLLALFAVMGITQGEITAHDIGFRIGPRINAAGRLGSAQAAYILLMASSDDAAKTMAQALEVTNGQRRELTEIVTQEANVLAADQSEESIIVVVGEAWPVGLVGLVASRLLERHQRPVLVMTKTALGIIGSGRSVAGFNIVEALRTMPHLFTKFGGHAQACGFTLQSMDAVAELRETLRTLRADASGPIENVLSIDEAIELRECNRELFEALQLIEPCGNGNPRPFFLVSNVIAVGVSAVGADARHIRLTVTDGVGTVRHAIGFNLGEWKERIHLGDRIDIVAEITEHTYRDVRDIQLRVIALRNALV